MIIVSGWIDVRPEQRDELLSAGAELQAATRTDEPGCLAYVFSGDPVVPGRIAVYEAWTDAESLDAHFAHPNYHDMRAVLRRFERLATEILKHDVARSAAVYGPDGVARATHWE